MLSPNLRTVFIGLGCNKSTQASLIANTLTQALKTSRLRAIGLSVPEFKKGDQNIADAARLLQIPILYIPKSILLALQSLCPNFSDKTYSLVGLGSVAEACALAATDKGGQLLVPKIICNGISYAFAEEKTL